MRVHLALDHLQRAPARINVGPLEVPATRAGAKSRSPRFAVAPTDANIVATALTMVATDLNVVATARGILATDVNILATNVRILATHINTAAIIRQAG